MEICCRTNSVSKIVPGFVVNVHDAINFDIDLSFTSQQRHRFNRVIKNEYQYKEESIPGSSKFGKAYRCRLKGIQLKSTYHTRGKFKEQTMKKATKVMERMINRSNGWVICLINGVDIYNRLLVDLIDPGLFPDKYVSYRDILLSEFSKLFSKYIPYHESSTDRHKQIKKQCFVQPNREYFSK